jgi:cell division protein FtsL
VATAAQHARRAPAPGGEREARTETPAHAYRAPHTRRKAAQRSRATRAFVIFVGCLTVLAVGRVALSFAVVQKTLQTDAIVREERRISDKNGQLQEKVAQLAATGRIRHIAVTDLGLVDVDPAHIAFPKPLYRKAGPEVAANR